MYLFTVSVGCHRIGMIKKGALWSNVIYAESDTINYVKILCKTSSLIKHPHFIVSGLTLSKLYNIHAINLIFVASVYCIHVSIILSQ